MKETIATLSEKAAELAEPIREKIQTLLANDENIQQRLNTLALLKEKKTNLENGIAAIEADISSAEKEIESKRQSLADGVPDAVKINRETSTLAMVVESGLASLKIMRKALTSELPPAIRHAEEDCSGACAILVQTLVDEHQLIIDESMQSAYLGCDAFRIAASAAAGELGIRLSMTQYSQLSMGNAHEYRPFLQS
jgi:hypothetical protein